MNLNKIQYYKTQHDDTDQNDTHQTPQQNRAQKSNFQLSYTQYMKAQHTPFYSVVFMATRVNVVAPPMMVPDASDAFQDGERVAPLPEPTVDAKPELQPGLLASPCVQGALTRPEQDVFFRINLFSDFKKVNYFIRESLVKGKGL
jgi:hypothetical protein